MTEPVWVNRRALLLLHAESLAALGGSSGMRDEGLFESALERAHMRWTYEPESSIAELAACYGFGLTKNHALLDGNKRLRFLAIGVFLRANGYRLAADRAEAVVVMEDVAAGTLDERALAAWLQTHLQAEPLGRRGSVPGSPK
jgi:death-on-curing protein